MHARLVRRAAGLTLAMVLGAAVAGGVAWEATRRELLDRRLASNLDLARVLAEDLGLDWGPHPDMRSVIRHWEETEPLYPGSMQVIGPGARVLFDSRGRRQPGEYVGERRLSAEEGEPATIGALLGTGRDWGGLYANLEGGLDAAAFADVPGQPALVIVRVPYDTIRAELRATVLPWAGALAVVAVGVGPASLLLLHRAYRLAIAETARAEAATARYAARLRTLQRMDRALLAASSPGEVAAAALDGIATVIPLRRAWVCRPGEDLRVLASLPQGATSCPPPGAQVIRVPFGGGHGEPEGELIVEPATADALEREQRDVLAEVADVLAVALREAHLHEEVARHAEELQARVDARTSQLQEAIRELEGFNYTVAHDLRAPLRSMAGLADVVRMEEDGKLEPRSVALLVGISDSAKRLDRLVTDLLSYARIGREHAAPVTVDLDASVRAAIERVQLESGAARAELTVEGPLPPVVASPVLLDQVLANLLSNAVKFVPPERDPRVRVRALRVAEGVRVEVRDNGVGIEPEHRERIFGVFERLHGRAFPGTGVGLAIVRRAIERMDGTLGVEPDVSTGGSVFWFVLPAAEGRDARSAEDGAARRG